MAKYKYTPFCPHCGHQVFNVADISHVVERPELLRSKTTCQHCYKTFTGTDVIYPGKITSEIYESMVTQMDDFKVLKVWDMNKRKLLDDLGVVPNYMKMLMHCIPDITPRHDIIFRWVWNDMLLDPGYTLQFEYKGNNYEIYAPMVNDRYLNYLDTYLDLAQQIVEDYLDGIDKKECLSVAKYMYFPICPYCGMQAVDVIEMETEITKPMRVRAVRTCIWCGKDFMEYDVIEPRERVEDSGIYMQLMRNLEDPDFLEEWKKKARDILYKTE